MTIYVTFKNKNVVHNLSYFDKILKNTYYKDDCEDEVESYNIYGVKYSLPSTKYHAPDNIYVKLYSSTNEEEVNLFFNKILDCLSKQESGYYHIDSVKEDDVP